MPKSMQAMRGGFSEPGQSQALQHLVSDSPWDAARVWTRLRAAVPGAPAFSPSMTPLPKAEDGLGGEQRQCCGALGKVGSCQVAVLSELIARRTWSLASEPESANVEDKRRGSAAVRLPKAVIFREKPKIALA